MASAKQRHLSAKGGLLTFLTSSVLARSGRPRTAFLAGLRGGTAKPLPVMFAELRLVIKPPLVGDLGHRGCLICNLQGLVAPGQSFVPNVANDRMIVLGEKLLQIPQRYPAGFSHQLRLQIRVCQVVADKLLCALKVNTFDSSQACRMSSKKPSARCYRWPFSQALVSALKVTTSGRNQLPCISSRKLSARCHCSPF